MISVRIGGNVCYTVNDSQEVGEDGFGSLACFGAGADDVTDRRDLENGTVLGSVHIPPECGSRFLRAVYGVFVGAAVTVRDMTEAIGGEEQVIGLLLPVSSVYMNENDLVLYAGSKGETQLCGRIDLEYAGLA